MKVTRNQPFNFNNLKLKPYSQNGMSINEFADTIQSKTSQIQVPNRETKFYQEREKFEDLLLGKRKYKTQHQNSGKFNTFEGSQSMKLQLLLALKLKQANDYPELKMVGGQPAYNVNRNVPNFVTVLKIG